MVSINEVFVLPWVAVTADIQSGTCVVPGSVPFLVKGKGDGLPRKSPRHNTLTCLFPSSTVPLKARRDADVRGRPRLRG